MTDNATPPKKKRPTYSRPTKYPAGVSIMTTTEQRAELDAIHEKTGHTLGEIVRALLDDGLVLLAVPSETRLAVQRLADEAGVSEGEAMTTMLDFAVRESKRRLERNAKLAVGIAQHLIEAGAPVDGVDVDGS